LKFRRVLFRSEELTIKNKLNVNELIFLLYHFFRIFLTLHDRSRKSAFRNDFLIFVFRILDDHVDKRAADTLTAQLISNFCTVYNQVAVVRSEEHTSELQSRFDLVCRL